MSLIFNSILTLIELALSGSIIFATIKYTELPQAIFYLLLCIPFALYPSRSLNILFLVLPIFGNKPGTDQYLGLTLTCAIFILCQNFSDLLKRQVNIDWSNKVVWTSYLYLGIGIISVFPHLSHPAIDPLSSFVRMDTLGDYFLTLARLLMADELKYFYPITAVINLGLALSVSRFVFKSAKQNPLFLKGLSFHIVTGVIISIILGLLDYFDFLSLLGIRELDPQVNSGGVQFRLQSFFGHSGWYAEYLTFGMPFVISLMLLPVRNWLKITLCLGTMIIGEYALILTYQRGGWISYPLTLIGIWSAIHVLKAKEQTGTPIFSSAFKKTFRKILISLPITIIISISLVKLYSSDSASTKIQKYTDRVVQITQTQDRTEYFKAGAALGLLHPIFGGGIESFGLQYVDEISNETGLLHKKYDLPFHGSAHNFYFQIFSGTGAIGLICILYLIFSTLKTVVLTLKSKDAVTPNKLALSLITGSFLLAILIYGVVQEIFYIQCLQILFFSALFGFAAEFPKTLPETKKIKAVYLSAILIAFISHLIWEQKSGSVKQQELRAFGCHPQEREETGWVFSWCGPTTYLPYKVKDGKITLKVQSILENPESKMMVFEGQNKIGEFMLQPGIYYEKIIPIQKEKTDTVWVTIKNQAAFIPDLVYPESNDFRLLSFKLTPTLE